MNAKVKVKKRSGRKRRAAGWTLLALGVLVAGVWVASGWVGFSYGGSYIHAWLATGQLGIYESEVQNPEPWRELYQIDQPGWLWQTGKFDNHCVVVSWAGNSPELRFGTEMMLWPIPLLLWAPAALLLRSGILARRRVHKRVCTKCGYSPAGLGTEAQCPECGKTSNSTPPRPA